MEKIYLVTYATHSDGLFDKLTKNEFNKKIDVIGWKTKFSNYIDKINELIKYINTKKDNDIIVYLDGFDSLINRNYNDKELLQLFLSYKTNILISKDPINMIVIKNKSIGKEIYNIKFGKYKNNVLPNMGMFMGYVKDLKLLFNCMIKQNNNDDQKALNKCYNSDIKIDTENIIFINTNYNDYISNKNNINSIFVSFPFGNTNTKYDNKRIGRFIFKESINYILIFILFILIIILLIKKFFKKIKTRNCFIF